MFDQNFIERLAQALTARIIPQIQKGNVAKATPKRLLTVKEAAAYLGRSESALYHLKARGEIPYIGHGRHLRFDVEQLNSWIKGDRV